MSDSRPDLATALDLAPHPEGGWFRETWRSPVEVTVPSADGTSRTRSTATLILFLLPAGECSAWHRVSSDEIWIANGDGSVTVELGGSADVPVAAGRSVVGLDLDAGESPQVVVPAGVWQRTLPSDRDALVSCMVSPGFDFADFELV